ncbi:MAG: serine/threonine-protein kinase [Cyanobacteria bacterium P01_D01_bin.1]
MEVISRRIERYRLHTELSTEDRRKAGRQTFLAKDTEAQESVVVKIIRLDKAIHTADQWLDLKLFERESNILQTLDHPSLPKYKDAFETDIEGVRCFVLVQTYLEANSLETLLQSGKRFSEAEVLNIAEQLLITLSYLHSQTPSVIHRDIKPSNILIGSRSEKAHCSSDVHPGGIYLIDFGSIHTDLTKESGTITIVGSYGYIPLEQFAGQAVPASDLYSLGMTLIYLVTGTHPADIAYVNGKIQLASRVLRPSFARWLERMTHPDLDRRFNSAEQALNALQTKEQNQVGYEQLKPKDTDIVVKRERDRLRILMDRPKRCPLKLIQRSTIGIAIVLLFYIPLSVIITVLVATIFRKTIRSFVEYAFKYLSKQQTVVDIERNHGIRVGIRSKIFGKLNLERPTAPFKALDRLAYNPGYKFDRHNKESSIPPGLSVYAGTISYPIGHRWLSVTEFWWLGQELSDFLDLELETVYPVPTVTVSN